MNLEFGTPYHNKTIDQCRAIGGSGGRRSGRNRRLRKLAEPSVRAAITPAPERETAHEASILLDKHFPHLRNARVRPVRRPAV